MQVIFLTTWPGLSGHVFFCAGENDGRHFRIVMQWGRCERAEHIPMLLRSEPHPPHCILQHRCGRVQHSAASLQVSAAICSIVAGGVQQSAVSLQEECSILLQLQESAAFCSIAARECSIAAGVYGIRQLQNGQLRGNYCDESGLSDDTVVSKKW